MNSFLAFGGAEAVLNRRIRKWRMVPKMTRRTRAAASRSRGIASQSIWSSASSYKEKMKIIQIILKTWGFLDHIWAQAFVPRPDQKNDAQEKGEKWVDNAGLSARENSGVFFGLLGKKFTFEQFIKFFKNGIFPYIPRFRVTIKHPTKHKVQSMPNNTMPIPTPKRRKDIFDGLENFIFFIWIFSFYLNFFGPMGVGTPLAW